MQRVVKNLIYSKLIIRLLCYNCFINSLFPKICLNFQVFNVNLLNKIFFDLLIYLMIKILNRNTEYLKYNYIFRVLRKLFLLAK